jgi:hypothetical protein
MESVMTKFLPLPILAIALLAVAPSAAAKSPPEKAANSPLVTALDACRQITDDAQRLACFDRASAALVGATASGDVSVVDRAQLRQTRKALFGFNMPRLPFFAGDKSAEDDKGVLDSTIKSVRSMGYERFQIVLVDGAIWETAQVYLSFSEPRKGQKIRIKRAPLGVYFLEIDGQVAVKGRRVG